MNINILRTRGFTLIELLTVIAIIGILAGILIPAVGAAKRAAKKTSSLVLFSQMETALMNYRAEYGYFPTQIQTSSASQTISQTTFTTSYIDLSSETTSTNFIILITGRNPDGTAILTRDSNYQELLQYNSKAIPFMSFSSSNFYYDPTKTPPISNDRIADSFNNVDITICMDGSGGGFIQAPGNSTLIRRDVGVVVTGNSSLNLPSYQDF